MRNLLPNILRKTARAVRMGGVRDGGPAVDAQAQLAMHGFLQGLARGAYLARPPGRPFVVVQVGANDGITADPVYPFVSEFPDVVALLVEPQPEVAELLKATYADFANAMVANFAIGPDHILRLWRINPRAWPHYRGIIASGITSSDEAYVQRKAKQQIPRHIAARLRADGQNLVESIDVECMKLMDALGRTNVGTHVDWLQVDTEGHDAEVIFSSDISSLKPRLIGWEVCHLTEDDAARVREFLASNGYSVYRYSRTDEAAVLKPNRST